MIETWKITKELILVKIYKNHKRRINEQNGMNRPELNEEGKIIHDAFVIIDKILNDELKIEIMKGK